MHEFAAEVPQLHQLAVDLIVVEDAHALFLRHLVFVEAVPHIGIDEVRAAYALAVIGDKVAAAGERAVLLHDLLVLLIQLVALGELKNLDEGRALIARTEPVQRYEPEQTALWNCAYETYQTILN